MSDYFRQNNLAISGFTKEKSWTVNTPAEAEIKGKVEQAGKPLKEWGIQINYGIKTGFNEAFIIDSKLRDDLVNKSPKNDEIIRPILLGKDIKRYSYNWDGKWVIFTRRGIEIDSYPFVKEYLYKFYERLKPRNNNETEGRKPGPYKWYEIQDNVAYYQSFTKPKIAWGNLALNAQFSLIKDEYYINAPSAFISSDSLSLLAILNSKLSDFYIKQLGVTRNGGYFEYKPMFIEQLPIPELTPKEDKALSNLAQSLINTPSDKIIENSINQVVYDLYDLSEEEKLYMDSI